MGHNFNFISCWGGTARPGPPPSATGLPSDPVHTEADPYDHHINLKSLKTSMTLKFVIILQNLIIKAYHRKSGKSKYDRKLTEPNVETTQIRSRVNGVSVYIHTGQNEKYVSHRGNRAYDLWNASPMPCKLIYAVRLA